MKQDLDILISHYEEQNSNNSLTEEQTQYLNQLKETRIQIYGESEVINRATITLNNNQNRCIPKIIENFLTSEECSLIIEHCKEQMVPSNVMGVNDNYRTSSETSLRESDTQSERSNNRIKTLKNRIAALVNLPSDFQEPFVVIKYNLGEEYTPHHDYFADAEIEVQHLLLNGGERILTVLMCLQAPLGGGETEFPILGLKIKQKAGQAVVWENGNKQGTEVYQESQHAGLPVLEGEKWMLTCWIRANKIN